MATVTLSDHDSSLSSPLSSAQSLSDHRASSPLSLRSRSPTPPPFWRLTPPPSQNADEDMPRPRKRRKIERSSRTTQYLDLTSDTAQSVYDREEATATLVKALKGRKKIVVIAGAGISVSAGIPDFRSSRGLFTSLKNENGLRTSGKELFDASVYKDGESTAQFHEMVRKLVKLSKCAKPTTFHHLLERLEKDERLLRLYTQNVDGLELGLQGLSTQVPLPMKPQWPKTIQLHGGLEKMNCQKCGQISDLDANIFCGEETPRCSRCQATDDIRTNALGRRSHGVGRLRPRMVLYTEQNPDAEAIGAVCAADIRTRPDAVVVVGTSMKIPGVRRLVAEMCKIVRDRKEGTTIWINPDPEPAGAQFDDCWDLIVKGKSDDVARLSGFENWTDDTPQQCTDSDVEKIISSQGRISVDVPAPVEGAMTSCENTRAQLATPPRDTSSESDLSDTRLPKTTTPVKVRLLVGERSVSAEKERQQRLSIDLPQLIPQTARGRRKLADVLGKLEVPQKSKLKSRAKRRITNPSGRGQGQITGRVVKSAMPAAQITSKKALPPAIHSVTALNTDTELRAAYAFSMPTPPDTSHGTTPDPAPDSLSVPLQGSELPRSNSWGSGTQHVFLAQADDPTRRVSTSSTLSYVTAGSVLYSGRETISPKSIPRGMANLLD